MTGSGESMLWTGCSGRYKRRTYWNKTEKFRQLCEKHAAAGKISAIKSDETCITKRFVLLYLQLQIIIKLKLLIIV